MGAIGSYIFRTTFGVFILVVLSLTALIWVTQALHDIDLMTSQGQTIFVFIAITGLIIPLLLLVIAPIALVVAVAYVLNKLGTDSEIIVMNAAGMSPWRLLRPLLGVAGVVAIVVAIFAAYVAPEGLRSLKRWIMDVRTDLVTNIIQPGRFVSVDTGVTFFMRERTPDGALHGIVIDDQRNPKEHITILAQQGDILKNDNGTYLILQNGSVQRHEAKDPDPTLVVFEKYAFDLSKFGAAPPISYSVRERYLWQLIWPAADDTLAKKEPGQFLAELHDRLIAPLYPIAFVLITYAYLGAPRTTRQSRSMSLLGAISAVAALRLIGFACIVIGARVPIFLFLQYVLLAIASGLSLWAIGRGVIIEPPAFLNNAVSWLVEKLTPRFAKAGTP